jgi:hypothetical protein
LRKPLTGNASGPSALAPQPSPTVRVTATAAGLQRAPRPPVMAAPPQPPSPGARLGPRSPVRVPFRATTTVPRPVVVASRQWRSPGRSSSLCSLTAASSAPPSGKPEKAQEIIKFLYGTDAGSPGPRTATAGLRAPLPRQVPPFPLLLPFPLATDVQPSLILGRTAPHAVHLVRRERVLQALSPHLAGGTDRLGLSDLPCARSARRHGKEQLRIRLPAGGQLPPVAPLLLKRGTLGW